MPTLRLPVWLVFWAAFLIELLHALLWRVYNFQPLLTRAEVFKTGGLWADCCSVDFGSHLQPDRPGCVAELLHFCHWQSLSAELA
jgi:hypothetical protein